MRAAARQMLEKWSRRYCVLPGGGSTLSYYKDEAAWSRGSEPLGQVECSGATIFLKEVSKDLVYRFTVRSAKRELKLRAASASDYEAWAHALKLVACAGGGAVGDEDARVSTWQGPADDDDDDDDDE